MSGTIRSYEDIIAWQKARVLVREVYNLTRKDAFARDYGLASQIQRAAVSVMANIAEGFERHGDPEFKRFLTIAKASCAEVGSHLYVALDLDYIHEGDFRRMLDLSREISRLIAGFRASLDAPRMRTRDSGLGTGD